MGRFSLRLFVVRRESELLLFKIFERRISELLVSCNVNLVFFKFGVLDW